jgi:ABC-type amino acid transport system permease subunit
MPKASDSASPDVVGRFDFLYAARRVTPSQTRPFVFLGTIKESFLFAAAVYWMLTFTSSRSSPRLEAGRGVGDR